MTDQESFLQFLPLILDRLPDSYVFDDASDYSEFYCKLLVDEAAAQGAKKDLQIYEKVCVKIDEKRLDLSFSLSEDDAPLNRGDLIGVKTSCGKFFYGIVMNIKLDGLVFVEMRRPRDKKWKACEDPYDSVCHIRCLFNDVAIDRCRAGIREFEALCFDLINRQAEKDRQKTCSVWNKKTELTADFGRTLLGCYDMDWLTNVVAVPIFDSPRLNPSQISAVNSFFHHRLSIIQGPPGTGKTTVACAIVKQCIDLGLRVLVVSPSNNSANNLLQKLAQCENLGKKIVRFCTTRFDVEDPALSVYSLPERLQEFLALDCDFAKTGYNDLISKPRGLLTKNETRRLVKLQSLLERIVLSNYRIVIGTCCGTGHIAMKYQHFDCIIVDEATQDIENMCMLPVLRGTTNCRAVLIGDCEQLEPVVLSYSARKSGLTVSLFERLLKIGLPSVLLNVQYRSHSSLSWFTSTIFYQNRLLNGVDDTARIDPRMTDFWPRSDSRCLFIAVEDHEEIVDYAISNQAEADAVVNIVGMLINRKVSSNEINVITSYAGQCDLLKSRLKDAQFDVDVKTVNKFQGRENNYILFSMVRSNDFDQIGFLASKRRINVALSRAKFGNILIGNPSMFRFRTFWSKLMKRLYQNRCIFYQDKRPFVWKPYSLPKTPIICALPAGSPRSHTLSKAANSSLHFNHMEVHGSMLGAAIGFEGWVQANIWNDFKTKMNVLPETETGNVLLQFNARNLPDLNAAMNFVTEQINIERDSRLDREARLGLGSICEKFHVRPNFVSDEIFKVMERKPHVIEFAVRHDVAGAFLSNQNELRQKVLELFGCKLFMGKQREHRSLVALHAIESANIAGVENFLSNYLAHELISYKR